VQRPPSVAVQLLAQGIPPASLAGCRMPEAPNAGFPASGSFWREPGASCLTVKGPSISKKVEGPDFSVGLGSQVCCTCVHVCDAGLYMSGWAFELRQQITCLSYES